METRISWLLVRWNKCVCIQIKTLISWLLLRIEVWFYLKISLLYSEHLFYESFVCYSVGQVTKEYMYLYYAIKLRNFFYIFLLPTIFFYDYWTLLVTLPVSLYTCCILCNYISLSLLLMDVGIRVLFLCLFFRIVLNLFKFWPIIVLIKNHQLSKTKLNNNWKKNQKHYI